MRQTLCMYDACVSAGMHRTRGVGRIAVAVVGGYTPEKVSVEPGLVSPVYTKMWVLYKTHGTHKHTSAQRCRRDAFQHPPTGYTGSV